MSEKYEKIGINYNLTRRADEFLVKRLADHLEPKKSGKYLDIGCGTGNYTIALSRLGLELTGIDPAETMLAEASAADSDVVWKKGRVERIPAADGSFEGVLATLTIHHWKSLKKSFAEINRVLKPNGRFVIFTSTAEQMAGYWLNEYFPQMLAASIRQMPTLRSIVRAFRANGFETVATERYFVPADLTDLFLYAGKYRPEIYLDESVRAGISSFSDLADGEEEVAAGLGRLETDIRSGEILKIISGYENDLGDYMFVVGIRRRTSAG